MKIVRFHHYLSVQLMSTNAFVAIAVVFSMPVADAGSVPMLESTRVLEAEHAFDALRLRYDAFVDGVRVESAFEVVSSMLHGEQQWCVKSDDQRCGGAKEAHELLKFYRNVLLNPGLQETERSRLASRDIVQGFHAGLVIIPLFFAVAAAVLGLSIGVWSRLSRLAFRLRLRLFPTSCSAVLCAAAEARTSGAPRRHPLQQMRRAMARAPTRARLVDAIMAALAARRQRQAAKAEERRRRREHGMMVSAVLPRPKLRWFILLMFAILAKPPRVPPPAEAALAGGLNAVALSKLPFIETQQITMPMDEARDWLAHVGPSGLEHVLPSTTEVALDFSLVDADSPALSLNGVPTHLSIANVTGAVAGLLGLDQSDVVLLRSTYVNSTYVNSTYVNSTYVNPTTLLASIAFHGDVTFQIMPNIRVGGDCANANDVSPAASHPRHPGRRRAEEQPEPTERPSKPATQRWRCVAMIEQLRTGRAARPDEWCHTPVEILGRSRDEVIQKREEYIAEYLHPPPKAKASGKCFAPAQPTRESHKRAATPANLVEPKLQPSGPSSETACAGPGRGHWSEAAGSSSIEEPIRIEQLKAGANWFEQAQQRKVRLP
jgi:hypothetical protein